VLGCKEFYDKTAARWAQNGYTEEAEPVCMDEFCALLPSGGRVLDLCCGAGYESFRLRRRGFEPVGLDLSGELAVCQHLPLSPGLSLCLDLRDNLCRGFRLRTDHPRLIQIHTQQDRKCNRASAYHSPKKFFHSVFPGYFLFL